MIAKGIVRHPLRLTIVSAPYSAFVRDTAVSAILDTQFAQPTDRRGDSNSGLANERV
jgi:hypothetical protein